MSKKRIRFGPKAQTDASSISVLILLIALFIALYLVLIPAEERNKLLYGDKDSETTNGEYAEILLSESPGKMVPYQKDEVRHDITSADLYSKVETKTEALASSLTVSNSAFEDKPRSLNFRLDKAESADVYFYVQRAEGELIIVLNNKVIFEGVPTANDLPLHLPTSYLKEDNELTFSVSSPGMRFWSSNKFVLQDVTLIKKVTLENKISSREFILTDREISSIDRAYLDYFVYCIKDEGSLLKIFLNNKLIFTDVIVCETKQPSLEIGQSDFVQGRNNLRFEISTGQYRVEQISILTKLRQKFYPRYSFFVEKGLFGDLSDNNEKLELRFKFLNRGIRKRATLTIGENQLEIDTKETELVLDISKYISEGANHLQIIPRSEFDISSMIVAVK